jgi:hypothetical protein
MSLVDGATELVADSLRHCLLLELWSRGPSGDVTGRVRPEPSAKRRWAVWRLAKSIRLDRYR